MKGLVLVYLITALGAFISLRKPIVGLFIYIGFAILRPQFIFGWAGDLNGISQIVGIAMLVGWVFNGLGDWGFGRGKAVVVALFTFAAWNALSAVQAVDSSLAFDAIVTLAKIVAPFLVGVTILTSEKHARWMMWTIVLAQGYVSLELNITYLRGFNQVAFMGFGGMDGPSFGISVVTTIGPAIALFLAASTWRERALAAAATLLMLHATLLTFSRGAFVGVIAVFLTAFIVLPKRPKYLAAMLVVGLLAIRLTGPELMQRYASTFAESDERDTSSGSRVELWLDCLKVVESRPLFGVGPWNWRVVASSFGWPEGKEAHSVWMETAAETGVPGVMSLLLFFGIAAARMWPIARTRVTAANRYQVSMAAGIIMAIAGFVVSGQFVSLTGLETPYYITMVGVALLKVHRREAEDTRPAIVAGRRLAPVPMPQVQQMPTARRPAF
jgi:putative inorganic carbon (HCO3(-)) transporter